MDLFVARDMSDNHLATRACVLCSSSFEGQKTLLTPKFSLTGGAEKKSRYSCLDFNSHLYHSNPSKLYKMLLFL
eukprot:g42620.t1